eukprot:478710-Alexandrium_andersonii.AAC.1
MGMVGCSGRRRGWAAWPLGWVGDARARPIAAFGPNHCNNCSAPRLRRAARAPPKVSIAG